MSGDLRLGLALFDAGAEEVWILSAALLAVVAFVVVAGYQLVTPATVVAATKTGSHAKMSRLCNAITRRFAIRRRAAPLRVFVFVTPAAMTPWPTEGWILDRSAGGLLVSIGAALDVGTILQLRPAASATSTAWTVVEVRHCRQEGGCWELGCRFVDPA